MTADRAGWLMVPSTSLLGRMRYAHKFVVVGLVLVIPLGFLAGAYVSLQRGQVDFSARERVGVAYMSPLTALTTAVVKARHRMVAVHDGNGPDLGAAMGAVQAADRRYGGELGVSAAWANVRRMLEVAALPEGSTPSRLTRYNTAVDALLALIVTVGDASNLTLDPDLDTFYLMDLLQFRLPVLIDSAGRSVDVTVSGSAGNASGVVIALGVANGVDASTGTAAARDVATVAANTADASIRRTTQDDGRAVAAAVLIFNRTLADAVQLRRTALVDPQAAQGVQAAAARASVDAARSLDRLLAARIDALTRRAQEVVLGAVAAAALAVYLFVGFYLSVVTPMRKIVATLRRVASGDLTQRVEVATRDELSLVADVLNETVALTQQATERLSERARHDPLTGLPNRVLVLEWLHTLTRHARGYVLFVDLDGFKTVNDSFGHEIGDGVLREVAERLRAVASASARVGRLSGDEFVVVTDDLCDAAGAHHLAGRIVQALSEPMSTGQGSDRHVVIGASVGIAAATDVGDASAEELLRRADVAMYQAKKHGGSRVEIYNDTLAALLEGRMRTQIELCEGIQNGAVTVHYQPILHVPSGRPAGFEALARWEHPQRGLLLPADFIEVAEGNGLIVSLGASVLAAACRQLVTWKQQGPVLAGAYVSVNVSPIQLSHPTFVASVADILAETGVNPHALCLEITETSIMADPERSHRALHELRALGIRLAIDDFGVGYSSLAYLSRFPVHILKVDRSFVCGMLNDRHDAAIVAMLITLGRRLDLSMVVEGVESPAQRDHLLDLGYSTMQGYLFGKAVPATAVSSLTWPSPVSRHM